VVTDDDPRLLGLVVTTLRDAGHCVFAAYDGESACELALTLPNLQLLITNTRLGTIPGRELIRRVRQEKPGLPILHLGEPLPREDGLLHDVPSLREPFTPAELLAAVKALLGDPVEPRFGLLVIAASAGGLEALITIFSGLPPEFPVPIAVVLHRSMQLPGMLAEILTRRTALKVKTAVAGEAPRPGTIYLAPPSRHLSLTPERTFALADGERIHHLHSAADPLFVSAAQAYGNRVVALVLTGGARDGAAGARAIGLAGGVVIAQNEATSEVFSMPRATIATGQTDAVLAIEEIGPALGRLVETGRLETSAPSRLQR
jgi:two-component system chemotaxis response regulator CheB